MNFGYFLQRLALTLSKGGIMPKGFLLIFWLRQKAELNPLEMWPDMRTWFHLRMLKWSVLFDLHQRGTLMSKAESRFSEENKLLTLSHIEPKPTHLEAVIVNQGWCLYIWVNQSYNSHIALGLLSNKYLSECSFGTDVGIF